MKYSLLSVAIFLIACTTKFCSGNQPSYQVSLYVHLHPHKPPTHVCNGVIVQSRLILTAASCLYYKISPNSPLVSLVPGMLSVIGGSSTKYHEELTLHVADIFVADKFNYTTGENDLAVLRLNGILPLDTRNDISWITLDDDKDYDEPCLANFFERNSPQGTPNYIQTEQMPILDAESCRVASEKLINRKNDICSLYYLPTDLNCEALETLENYTDDRGTGLVCANKLIGLLSTVVSQKNASDCQDRTLKAFYTSIVPHISWIFKFITEEDRQMYQKGEYISSSPYAGETNAFIDKPVTVTESISVLPTPADLPNTLPTTGHNTASRLATLNCYYTFLYGILAIISATAYPY